MSSLLDSLQVLLTRFTPMAWRTASKSMASSLPDLTWLLRFLQPKWSFFNVLVTVIWSIDHLQNKCFWLLLAGFTSMAWGTVSKYTILGLPGLAWLLRFLQPKRSFLNNLVTVLWRTVSLLFVPQMFLLLKCYSFIKHSSWIRLLYVDLCSFHIAQNEQCISTTTTMILSTTACTCHGLNCFGHVIYVLTSSVYQNIAELLTSS